MALFNFTKKQTGPYKEESTNYIYNLLFCDDPELFKKNFKEPYTYPFDILFADTANIENLQKVIDDAQSDPRAKMLAYNRQMATGHRPTKREILGVIVEVGLDKGLDVLASFNNGTARYINQTGKMIIWETTDATSNALTNDLFTKARDVVAQIGPWNKPRKRWPQIGNVRLNFLVSDGLYFGEGVMNSFFNDPLAKPILGVAAALMNYLTERSMQTNK